MKNKITSKLMIGALAVALLTTATPVTTARAASTDDLQAQIAALLAQINSLQAQIGTANTPRPTSVITQNLSQGMSGSEVKALQQFLNSDSATVVAQSGAGSKGNETTYFGPATKAAVIKFQNKYAAEILTPVGLSQGTGFVGASTRAQIAKLVAMNPTPTPDTTPDENDDTPTVSEEGEITVTRGNEHTTTLEMNGDIDPIYSVDIEAEDSSMTISRIDFMLDKRPWQYIDTFILYQEGTKIGEIKASSDTITSVGNEYRVRFSGLSVTVKKGDTDEFVLEAKALKSISSTRVNNTLSVYIPRNGIRALDTAKLISEAPGNNLEARTFDFRDADDDGQLTVSLSNDSPRSSTIVVKENANTTNKTVLDASLKAEDSDLLVNEIYLKVDSSEPLVTNVVRNISLQFDGKTIATESVKKNNGSAITSRNSNGNTYTVINTGEYYVHFDNLKNVAIDEDDRENLSFVAEFYKQSGRYRTGTDVTFTLRGIEAENKNGEDVYAADLDIGNNQTFTLFTDGLTFTFSGDAADTKGQLNQRADYSLEFSVTPFGNDIYVPMSVDRQVGTSTVANVAAVYSIIDGDSTRYSLGTVSDTITIKNAKTTGNFYRLSQGTTYQVTVKISLENVDQTAGFYKTTLEAFRYHVGSTNAPQTTITTGFEDFETEYVYVRN